MAKHLLIVKADYNDADYVTEISEVSDKDLAKLRPIFNKIKNYYGDHNWASKHEYLTEDEVDRMENYVPYAPDSMDIHSIASIKIYDFTDTKTYI